MKFLKVSFLTVLVVLVSVFIFCETNGPKEGASVKEETCAPLTEQEIKREKSFITAELDMINAEIVRKFNKGKWNDVLRAYKRMEKNTGFVWIKDAQGKKYHGSKAIKNHWKNRKNSKPELVMTIDRTSLTFNLYGNINIHTACDELDMEVVETTLIKIVEEEISNDDYTSRGERRHKRECEW